METKAINTKLKGHARVDVADVLRGLAVMGIIILHSIEHFNFYSFPDTAGQSAWLNFSDKAIWNGLFFMFGGKAYAIFALLFGFSFFIQDDNQRLRGNDFRLRFCWRLILLFLIGNINASFFTAEVLVLYSLVGFILPLTCRLKDKWIFALACLLLIQPLPLYYVIRACLDPEFVTPAIPTRSFWNATFAVQSNGNFLETIRVNLWEGQLASLAWAWDHGRVFFMFGGKAYAIFALLFGFSFFIQDDNQRLRGNDFRLRFCWRLILLFLIGNINASFFTAEVLVLYSLVGFILPLTCRLKDKWIFALACLLLIQPLPLYYVIRACLDPEFVTPAIPTRSFWNATFAVQSNGNFLETIRVNLWEGQLASLAWAWDHGRVFQTAALFLLGMLIGRKGLFLKEHLKVWNKVLAGSLVAFFPLYGLGNMLPDFITNKSILTPLSLIITSLSNFAFMLILVSGVVFAFYKTNLHDGLMKITPYGKMSLTNYITQSIVGSMLYYNWGFALHNQFGITASCLAGIVFFILQFSFCRWWMNHHSHGPMEYIWKRATWLK